VTAERLVGVAVAVVLMVCGVAAMGVGLPIIVDYLTDPDAFLASVAAIFGAFLVGIGVVATVTAWGVLREARWAWEVALLATGLLLLTGLGGMTDARAAGSLPLVEVALALGGMVLAALLVLRWALRRHGGRPAG